MKTYYIYEVPTQKNGATIDWNSRKEYNFNTYQIEPVIIETIEGEDNEDTWQIVGDREWYYADLNGYDRGTHYKVIRTRGLNGYLNESKRSKGFPIESCIKGGLTNKGKPNTASRSLTQKQAKEIRSKYIPRKYDQKTLAQEYGVHVNTIKRIIKGTFYNE